MRNSWITALAWILIAAVPVQGFAAALMVNCGPRHHGPAGPSAQVADLQGHHAHASNSSGHTHKHNLTVGVDLADPQQASALDPSAPVSCSACAACCIGIGLASAVTLPPGTSPSSPPRFEAADPAVDIVASGPERPPRLFLV